MKKLPIEINLETIQIYKKLNIANGFIGELRGLLTTIPNPDLILKLITIQESKDSSAIENIFTTYDEILKELVSSESKGGQAKEVVNYREAIEFGFEEVKQKGYINTNVIVSVHEIIEGSKSGLRKLPGTKIMNSMTGEVVHTPPQNELEIKELMHNLEVYMNSDNTYDPLINMAVIHFQFESIHPFYDGNGRMGRILNILYLVLKGQLQKPILYLSKYIIQTKQEYYRLLRLCNEDIKYIVDFVLYFIEGVVQMSKHTINLINEIVHAIDNMKTEFQSRLPDIYRYEIVEHLFYNLYTKNELFREDLGIARQTATKYLKLLEDKGFLQTERVGKELIYKNVYLHQIIE